MKENIVPFERSMRMVFGFIIFAISLIHLHAFGAGLAVVLMASALFGWCPLYVLPHRLLKVKNDRPNLKRDHKLAA